jgi:pyruvate formate lyase activating enzyme
MKGHSRFKEALLYEARPDGSARCGVCERRCRIPRGERGFCGSRLNVDGRLYALTYGDLTSVTNNPIEKKPLFHYWPGSTALSAGSRGCNLRCVCCQNHALSMAYADPDRVRYTSPEGFVALATKMGSGGLSFTFNEASCTLLEYVLDCFRLVGPRRLYRNLNTNGYMTSEALCLLIEAGLDSLCFDIKGDEAFYRRFCSGADPEPVWRNSAEAKRRGLHVEMVNLVVPGGNDGRHCIEEVITRSRDELGRDTPLHFTRFYPAYRAREHGLNRITPVETLENVRSRALELGLNYVYIGNVQGHTGENTYCPKCGRLLVDRDGFKILGYTITGDGLCPECGTEVPIVGKPTLERDDS